MSDSTSSRPSFPAVRSRDALTEVLQHGAPELLGAALQAEVQAYLDAHGDLCADAGRRLVTRNGFLPERESQTGIGPAPVRQPRVRDRRDDTAGGFSSKILPPYLRRTKSVEELLHGSTSGASRPATSATR